MTCLGLLTSFLTGLGMCVFLDNANSTNKNRYLDGWTLEMVQHGILDTIRAPFLITGHTKFAPDRVFASIVNSYNKSDVFNCQALVIASHYATAVEETGMHILYWRQELDKKYTQLAGIRQYHDFFASRISSGNSVVKVKEECGSGDYKVDRLKLQRGSKPQDECFPDPTCNYVPKFSAFTHI